MVTMQAAGVADETVKKNSPRRLAVRHHHQVTDQRQKGMAKSGKEGITSNAILGKCQLNMEIELRPSDQGDHADILHIPWT